MHSRLLPAPWPPQRGLARRGNGPCSILTRRPSAVAGPATARLPGSHWEGWCAVAGPACSSSKLPPIQESRQRPLPRCYRLAAAPTQRCVWPAALMITCAQAQLIMLLAALHQTSYTFLHSPHDHQCTPLFYPQDPSFPPPSCGHVYPQMRAFGDKRHPAHPALVQHSEFCPPFTPALPDVVSAERGAYLGIADFPGALPRPGRATRFSTPEPSPAGAGNSSP